MRLAEFSAREGNLRLAESYLQLATDAAPEDLRSAEELIAVLGVEGQKEKSQKLAREWLARFPQSYFLLEQLGEAGPASSRRRCQSRIEHRVGVHASGNVFAGA